MHTATLAVQRQSQGIDGLCRMGVKLTQKAVAFSRQDGRQTLPGVEC
jgi:hypothetical protein